MKKGILIAGLLSGIAGTANAQTNITLYGVVDMGLDYTNNDGGKSVVKLESGYAQGSRFGFKGNEDLGGGLSAVFQLENGFNASTGAFGEGGLLFGRQAFVGLSSKTAGTVTLGRQYDSVIDYVSGLTANGNWAGYLFAHPLDNDNTDYSFHINNSLKYTSPTIAGFTFGGVYGFGQTAGDSTRNSAYSLGASYANGPLSAGLAYVNLTSPGSTASGAVTPIDVNFFTGKQKTFGAGINYAIGATTLGFVYTHTNLTNPTSSEYIGSLAPAVGTLTSLKFNNYEINAKYQFTPAFYAGAMFTYTQARYATTVGTTKPKWSTFGLMADYNFSKRTDVYVQGIYQKVSGDMTGSTLDDAYIPGAGGISDNEKQVVLRVALRQLF
ncbi:porin [Paraburkholderia sp.]|uniref:porin n=1 Tax=Paraburkholderia sp. TaxID=1926495 RepID=UPI003C7CEECF